MKKKISMRKAQCLKKWLELEGNEHKCPFKDYITCRLCKDSFPNLPKDLAFPIDSETYHCPCHIYTLKHVISVARRYVKEAGL